MNKLLALALFAAVGSASLATPARAQTPTAPTTAPTAAPTEAPTEGQVEVRTLRNTRIDFTEAYVEGQLRGPQGVFTKARKKPGFRNLIELRGNFRPELASSTSGL